MDQEKQKKMIVYDLVFGLILIIICTVFVFKSATMTRPRSWLTAPGLPPLVIFLSLGGMGLALFLSAIRSNGLRLLKGKADVRNAAVKLRSNLWGNNSVLLAVIFLFYFIIFTKILPFELSTFLYLFIVFKIFWKRSLPVTLLSSLIITISFSLMFSKIFKVMLPGVAWRDFLPL